MAFDKDLAKRIINKAGKEITAAMVEDGPKQHDYLVRALNDILFMHDVLHLDEPEKELDVIDPYRI